MEENGLAPLFPQKRNYVPQTPKTEMSPKSPLAPTYLCDAKSHGKANTGVTLYRHELPACTTQTSRGRTLLHTEVVPM